MQAVLWDMDGTLVDSEKLWDISLAALYAELGGELTSRGPGVDGRRFRGKHHADRLRRPGSEPDPRGDGRVRRWLHDYTGELFDGGLPWCDGARELLEALAAEGTPMALVTNTQRLLTEVHSTALAATTFRRRYAATRCRAASPRPTRTGGPPRCSAWRRRNAWPSRTRSPALPPPRAAGCPVLVVPNEVEVPAGPAARACCVAGGTSMSRPCAACHYATGFSSSENAPPDLTSVIECDVLSRNAAEGSSHDRHGPW